MNISGGDLLVKADHNHLAGEWAEKKGYFDVAVSRYYYALFQKALYILHQKPGFREPEGQMNSHVQVIEELEKHLWPRLKDEEITWLSSFKVLKKRRTDADYRHKMLTINEFNLGFKYSYNQIAKLLERFLGGRMDEQS